MGGLVDSEKIQERTAGERASQWHRDAYVTQRVPPGAGPAQPQEDRRTFIAGVVDLGYPNAALVGTRTPTDAEAARGIELEQSLLSGAGHTCSCSQGPYYGAQPLGSRPRCERCGHPAAVPDLDEGQCPMCEPGTCPGGAHRNALAEDGITSREQFAALKDAPPQAEWPTQCIHGNAIEGPWCPDCQASNLKIPERWRDVYRNALRKSHKFAIVGSDAYFANHLVDAIETLASFPGDSEESPEETERKDPALRSEEPVTGPSSGAS